MKVTKKKVAKKKVPVSKKKTGMTPAQQVQGTKAANPAAKPAAQKPQVQVTQLPHSMIRVDLGTSRQMSEEQWLKVSMAAEVPVTAKGQLLVNLKALAEPMEKLRTTLDEQLTAYLESVDAEMEAEEYEAGEEYEDGEEEVVDDPLGLDEGEEGLEEEVIGGEEEEEDPLGLNL